MEDLTVIMGRKLYNHRDKFKWSEQHDEVHYKPVEKDYCYDVTQGMCHQKCLQIGTPTTHGSKNSLYCLMGLISNPKVQH
jgi:hypothetical protein